MCRVPSEGMVAEERPRSLSQKGFQIQTTQRQLGNTKEQNQVLSLSGSALKCRGSEDKADRGQVGFGCQRGEEGRP